MKKDSLATFDSVGLRGRGLLGNSLGMEAGRCNLPALPLFNFHFFYFSFFSFFLFLPSFLLSFLFFYFAFFPFLLFLVGTIFALPSPTPALLQPVGASPPSLLLSRAPISPKGQELLHMSSAAVCMSGDLVSTAATQGMPLDNLALEARGACAPGSHRETVLGGVPPQGTAQIAG